jgi:hypothetical protein
MSAAIEPQKTYYRTVAMQKLLVVMFVLALMTACSSTSTKPAETTKPQPKPPEVLTARSAFQRLYISARSWGQDARPYRVESATNNDSNGRDGKSAIWRAFFASAMQRGTKPYTWSGSEGSERGVNPGIEDNYNPSNASTHAFDIAFLKIDSDKAFEVAQQHGGSKVLDKAPDTAVLYILEWNRVENVLLWHVIYGSREAPKLKVAVDASTGEFLRVEKS